MATNKELPESEDERPPLTYGKLLKEWRTKAHLSMNRVGRQFGWATGQYIWNWENEYSTPAIKYIPRLSKLYKVPDIEIRKALAKYEIARATAKINEKYGTKK